VAILDIGTAGGDCNAPVKRTQRGPTFLPFVTPAGFGPRKGRTMAGDLFDLLIKVRDAAEVANGSAQEVINRYRRKPDFSWAANSRSERTRRAQQRAAARDKLLYEDIHIRHIRQSVARFRERTSDALDLIRRAVAPTASAIHVGNYSYPTAHEAAEALGNAVHQAWQNAGGYDAVERAPDRFRAEYDADDADIAIEVSVDIWKRLRLGKNNRLPPDLWGQIQLEFAAAWDRLELETATESENVVATDAGWVRASITVDEANAAAMKLAKQDATFVSGTIRQWAARIKEAAGKTCSLPTVKATPLWQETMKRTGRGRAKGGRPKVVSLTSDLEAAIGDGDKHEVLNRLIAEHKADFEPSPVKSDPAEKPTRVRPPNRL